MGGRGGGERRNKEGDCRVNKASWEISPLISTSHFNVFSSAPGFNKLRIKQRRGVGGASLNHSGRAGASEQGGETC